MDEHRLRLRFENGLSTSRGENAVRRVNKRLRSTLAETGSGARLEAAQGLLRDQETLREMVLVHQLRARKIAKQRSSDAAAEEIEKRRKELEEELRHKRDRFVATAAPSAGKSDGKGRPDSSREPLLPVSTCEAQLKQIKRKEEELDRLILRQQQDFTKWKKAALEVEDLLKESTPDDTRAPRSSESTPNSDEMEPKTKMRKKGAAEGAVE